MAWFWRIWSALRRFPRRHPWAVGFLLFLVALRAALPLALRPVLETQLSELLNGKVTIEDVDLSLLRGGIAFRDVAVLSEATPEDPVVRWRRLYARIQWTALWNRTVRLRLVLLDTPEVRFDRLEDGGFNLVGLIASSSDGADTDSSADESASDAESSWSFSVDRIQLHNAIILARDLYVDMREPLQLTIDSLDVRSVPVVGAPSEEPTQIHLEAHVEQAPVRIRASIDDIMSPVRIEAEAEVDDLELGRGRVYIPVGGWTSLRGRATLRLQYALEPEKRHEIKGTVVVDDAAVDVEHLERSALSFGNLAFDIASIDLLRHRVDLDEINLRNAEVVIMPRDDMPLPLLGRRSSPTDPADDRPLEQAQEGETNGDSRDGAPWSWSVAKAAVGESRILLRLQGEEPLEIAVDATAENVSADSGRTARVDVRLRDGDRTFGGEGNLVLQPLGFAGNVQWSALSLPRLARFAGGGLEKLLDAGTTSGRLDLVAAIGAAPEADKTETPGTVRLEGRLALGDLAVSDADGDDFAVGWDNLTVEISELRLPGLLAESNGAPRLPAELRLGSVVMTKPAVRLTRMESGLVLPSLSDDGSAREPGGQTGKGEKVSAPAKREAQGTDGLSLRLGELKIEDGSVTFVDESLQRSFEEEVGSISLLARDLAWPEWRIGELDLSMVTPGGAPLRVTGTEDGENVQLRIDGERIDLDRLDPYAAAYSVYRIKRGTASLRSRIRVAGESYKSKNKLTLHDLRLKADDESAFEDQFGIPLSLALALLRDVKGNIVLDVPVDGDVSETRVDLTKTISGVLQRTLLNALASPLKLVGMVQFGGSKIERFKPEPIRFIPGRAVLNDEGRKQLDRLGKLLAERPGLAASLKVRPGRRDVRWFQARSLLEAMRNGAVEIPEIAEKAVEEPERALRAYLEAHVAGSPAELPTELEAALEQLLAERDPPPDEQLQALLEQRTAAIHEALAQHPIEPERITSSLKTKASGSEPTVRIDIQARS